MILRRAATDSKDVDGIERERGEPEEEGRGKGYGRREKAQVGDTSRELWHTRATIATCRAGAAVAGSQLQ